MTIFTFFRILSKNGGFFSFRRVFPKKKPRKIRGSSFFLCLSALDCSDGAAFCASATIDAFVGVDFVFTAVFGNSTYRASVRARSASDAFITDFVCHSNVSFSNLSYLGFPLFIILPHRRGICKGFQILLDFYLDKRAKTIYNKDYETVVRQNLRIRLKKSRALPYAGALRHGR